MRAARSGTCPALARTSLSRTTRGPTVSSSSEMESILREVFEDVALLIGGAASLHVLEDGLVRSLIRGLGRVRSGHVPA